jgi:sialate O-acetylesterase
MRRWIILVCLVLLANYLASGTASLKLPTLVGSHMVLQQKDTVRIWGWAQKGTIISIWTGWDDQVSSTITTDDDRWEFRIHTPAAGGPYQIVISADSLIVLEDIMIGEVWICSGQSNMEMPLKGYASQPVYGSNDFILHSGNYNIRHFQVGQVSSAIPENDCTGKWETSAPSSTGDFSAVAYLFGKHLYDILKVPVGLINASWDGAPIRSWIERSVLQDRFKEIDLSEFEGGRLNKRTPSGLFNGMIHPVTKYTIKGAVWYQGESDRHNPERYQVLFSAMIENWRACWKQGDFPFYFVQIAPYKYDSSCNAAFLREAQLKTMLDVPNTGMVTTTDIGEYDCIHPGDKETVGKRLAYWALAKTYHIEGISYCGPIYREMKTLRNKLFIWFDQSENGLTSFDTEIKGFEISSESREFFPAEAKINIKENHIELWSRNVELPVAVRYCWGNFIQGNLYNTAGLPASPFRSDNWSE